MKISRNLNIAIAPVGLLAGPASSLEARNRKKTDKKESSQHRNNKDGRGGRTAGALVGAGVVGTAVGVGASSAGWGLLGAAGGGIAGYFLVRAIQKGRKNRRNREHKNKEMRTDRNRLRPIDK
ncbi:hypothetical protein E3J61_00915 [Candidatus Dependentiae bacterium]|nr:MAG: hypothetical protein E3J61_00915 [Candidatus Dependentiae bacterium]